MKKLYFRYSPKPGLPVTNNAHPTYKSNTIKLFTLPERIISQNHWYPLKSFSGFGTIFTAVEKNFTS